MAALLVATGLSASEAAVVTFIHTFTLWFAVAIGALVLPWLTLRDVR